VINKSKFISIAYPVFDEDSCKKYLDELNKKYSDATHICFAYVLSSPKVEKCSDNGEPSGTAGKPLLELLKKKKLSNVMIVVIRYFGGIKLGAGGLVRAYTNSGNLSLNKAKVIEVKEVNKYRVRLEYDSVNQFKNLIASNQGSIIKIEYSERTIIEFICEDISAFGEYDLELIGSEKIWK
jgi:uncharacterized YigZ family protein